VGSWRSILGLVEGDRYRRAVLDALGIPQSVLVLGGGSEIAGAVLDRLAGTGRLQRVVLAVRTPGSLDDAVRRLSDAGVPAVEVVTFDAADPGSHVDLMDDVFGDGEIDLVLLAAGVLGDTDAFVADPPSAAAAAAVNFGGAMSATLAATAKLQEQGQGKVVILSSVAAERVRADNFVYGATKAGLDGFAQGLSDALQGTGVSVLVVRPGFVHSKMTEGLEPPPIGVTEPGAVADDVVKGLASGADTIWSPGYLRFVFSGMRHLPRPVWRKASAR
jgi:decaprenylphospho-beta-D-erythro-pentofuranosid-2-ulose 2-reductase